MKLLLSLIALTGFSFAAGCSGTPATDSADSETDEADLVNAPRDTANPWSVGVCSSAPNTDPKKGAIGACVEQGTRCTGTLVAPNLVLTARHCVRQVDYSQATSFCTGSFTSAPLTASPVNVTLAPSVTMKNPGWRRVDDVIVPAGAASCDDDLALLLLRHDVPASLATPVAVGLGDLVASHPAEVAIVGRGGLTDLLDPTTLNPVDPVTGGFRRRFLEHVAFRCISDVAGTCTTLDSTSDGDLFALPAGYFLTGPGTASGDSGAGMIDQASFTAHAPVVIGVASASTYDMSGVGNAGLAVRLDTQSAFLLAGATKAAARGGYPLPTWAPSSGNP